VPWRWRGHDIFATQDGSGPLVLLVHGIYAGSSSYEYRKLFPLLARNYRVVAIDLLGCGLSDRPNLAYSAQLYVDQIADAIEFFGPGAAALVGSSMGAAFSTLAAARLGRQVGSLALVCPTGIGTLERAANGTQNALRRFILTPVLGQAFFDALASRPSLRWFLVNQAYADPASATPEVVEDYWIATHQPGSRYVPAHFVGGALNCSIREALPQVPVSVLVTWGERADTTSPVSSAPQYVELARKGELATFAHSRLLPHEEEPDAFAARLETFISAAER
jgi:pimeloyl-ACP methyl ester carboxylesterase